MTTSYDSSFDPAAPVLSVALTGLVHLRPQIRLPALIDTGADMTAIPSEAIKRLHLFAIGRMKVEDIHAKVTIVEIYTVRVAVTGQPIKEMEVVQTEQPFVILGRDWLQSYYLLLNGPEQTFLLSDTPLTEEA
jgi:predicted aspartyl protease